MVSLLRRVPVGRAYREHLRASRDRGCGECWGVVHIWRQRHAQVAGRASLVQDVVCVHCNARYARTLPVPVRPAAYEALVGLALLAFASLRLPNRLLRLEGR